MIRKLTFAAVLTAATVLAGVANAKTLVYCSEAAPAGFDPSPWSDTFMVMVGFSVRGNLFAPCGVRARQDQHCSRPG